MLLLQRAVKSLGGLGLVVALPAMVFGQPINTTNFYAAQGSEYAPAGGILGDQANSALSINPLGGYLVWQDNATDGDGLGISAVGLDSSLSPKFGNFRVNVQGAGDQENPQVALLAGGGAVFVWQGGSQGFQHIYARFLSSSNLWLNTNDLEVNTATNYQQDPAIAALPNGNVVVVWSSYGQDNADGMLGVYGQILSPIGQKVGSEFQVNQFTSFNQRTPAVAAFPNGNFIAAWVSEEQRSSISVDGSGSAGTNYAYNSVDIYARLFNSSGSAGGNTEFLVNTATNTCANPSLAVAADNSYFATWSEKNPGSASSNLNNSWDIFGRRFNSAGTATTDEVLINSQRYGDQYAPKVSADGTNYLVVWTSLGQDGSQEGVFGQFVNSSGGHAGGEMQVNTVFLNMQKYPTVASDGSGRFLVAWSSFISVANGLDVRAQRYATTLQALPAPNAPYVIALDSYSLSVTWPPVAGFNVSYYNLYIDGLSTPEIVFTNMYTDFNFEPGTPHTFQLQYVLTDGSSSPFSSVASGTTWGDDKSSYGVGAAGLHSGDLLPDDWETRYYGTNRANWPKQGIATVLAPGVTVGDVFNWGADPTNPSTWLQQWITRSAEGMFLNWNTVPGGIYQVLTTTNLQTWTPVGSPRFEAGTSDSLFLGGTGQGYFRIVRNRY